MPKTVSVGSGLFDMIGGLLGMGKVSPAMKGKIVRKLNGLVKSGVPAQTILQSVKGKGISTGAGLFDFLKRGFNAVKGIIGKVGPIARTVGSIASLIPHPLANKVGSVANTVAGLTGNGRRRRKRKTVGGSRYVTQQIKGPKL